MPLDLLTGPWALPVMSLLVFGDAFLVVVPGEIAVTVLGAIASSSGSPSLWAVIGCAGAAAALGDIACYLIGRSVGLERWGWMRRPRIRAALDWAGLRLDGGTASVLFTARFVPFARLAINLVAGASRIHPGRYLALVTTAALGWAAYQASVGAVVAAVIPGGAGGGRRRLCRRGSRSRCSDRPRGATRTTRRTRIVGLRSAAAQRRGLGLRA